jgi:hypothetical protein
MSDRGDESEDFIDNFVDILGKLADGEEEVPEKVKVMLSFLGAINGIPPTDDEKEILFSRHLNDDEMDDSDDGCGSRDNHST